MSYDLLLFATRPRSKDMLAAFERASARDMAARADANRELTKRALARALVERVPALQASDPGTLEEPRRRPKEPIDIELVNERRGIEVCLYGSTAAVSVPYWYPGKKAEPVASELAAILATLVELGGYFVYDPQRGEFLDLQAATTRRALARGIGAHSADLDRELDLVAEGRRPEQPTGRRPVRIEWEGYELFDPFPAAPLQDLPRAAGKRVFDQLTGSASGRLGQLRRLLDRNGGVIRDELTTIEAIESLLLRPVEEDPAQPDGLQRRWRSVVIDSGLCLGDLMIRRSGGRLRWTFFDTASRGSVSRNRPVIMGFAVKNPKYNVDIIERVSDFARDALRGEAKSGALTRIIAYVMSLAGVGPGGDARAHVGWPGGRSDDHPPRGAS